MTTDEIRIACAESGGYKDGEGQAQWWYKPQPFDTDSVTIEQLPDYPNSRDAIVLLVKKLPESKRRRFVTALLMETGEAPAWWEVWEALNKTPLQLCIAYLKTKGLYHE